MRTNLKIFRVKQNLTQEQFAKEIGYERSSYADVENGKREPSMRFCKAISEAYGVPLTEVVEMMQNDED